MDPEAKRSLLPVSVADEDVESKGESDKSRRNQGKRRPLFSFCRQPRRVYLVGGALVFLVFLSSQIVGVPQIPSPPPEWPSGGDDVPPPPPHHQPPQDTRPDHAHHLEPGSDGKPGPGMWKSRAKQVKAAFVHAYSSYERYAFPMDELMPLSKEGQNNFNGFGVSVIDSLDTMFLMGLEEEFTRGLTHVAGLNMSASSESLPFFETTIRYLGGLLSAYALSDEPIFLAKADELGQILVSAFNTPSGLPAFSVKADSGQPMYRTPPHTYIAEMGTCQLEFKYLAHLTGNSEYFEQVDKQSRIMLETQSNTTGIWGNTWYTKSGVQAGFNLQVGGTADSAYEYLLKGYLQSAKSEPGMKDMYLKAVDGIIQNLVYISPRRSLMYVTDSDITGNRPSGKLEHLSCYLPGVLALGAESLELDAVDKERHKWVAEGIARTCWLTYADSKSGLGPDEVMFDSWPVDKTKGRWVDHLREWESKGRPGGTPPGVRDGQPLPGTTTQEKDYYYRMPAFQLRPETIESLFILWKTTGDEVWRERGWQIFENIERHARVEDAGYSGINWVDQDELTRSNNMPSWFLAETLKYLYLLFSDENLIPLDKWVFNTEAHPLPVIDWREWERVKYKIGQW